MMAASMGAAVDAARDGSRMVLHTGPPAELRRDWAVVLYSGECEEHPGLRCATQGFGPCTLAETDAVVAAVPEGFCAHRISLLDPLSSSPGRP